MSTRCNIIIKNEENKNSLSIIQYRHCDGYPNGVGIGQEIIRALEAYTYDCDKLSTSYDWEDVCALIEEECNTEIVAKIHSDIEWLYTIIVNEGNIDNGPWIKYQCFKVDKWIDNPDDYKDNISLYNEQYI